VGDQGGELASLLERARAAGIDRLVCIGTGPSTSRQAVAVARATAAGGVAPRSWASIGLHPHEASEGVDDVAALLTEELAARDGAVVAVGECGLDYYYEHSPRDAQDAALRDQLRLAMDHDLGVVLHVRDAFDDLLGILGEVGVPPRSVVHCFSAGPEEAQRCLEAGLAISVAGIVTFKNAAPLREALHEVPLDALLVETDSPFLAPVPFRGRPNEPAHVAVVGEAVAQTLNLESSAVRAATSATASRLFRCPEPT